MIRRYSDLVLAFKLIELKMNEIWFKNIVNQPPLQLTIAAARIHWNSKTQWRRLRRNSTIRVYSLKMNIFIDAIPTLDIGNPAQPTARAHPLCSHLGAATRLSKTLDTLMFYELH